MFSYSKEKPATWSGSHRAPLVDQDVFPKTDSGRLTAWIGVGGSAESVVRSVRTAIPMVLAIIGGDMGRFLPYAELYGRASDQLGLPRMPLGALPRLHRRHRRVRPRAALAALKTNRDRIGAERGWPPVTEAERLTEIEQGSLSAGSPETVARWIAAIAQTLGLDRSDLKYANGTMPHEQLITSIELYCTQVIPLVREILA